MKLLVTGGAGYIGSATSQLLIDSGHQVVVYDSLEKGHQSALPKEALLVKADLSDHYTLNQVFKQFSFDAVLHFAAYIEAGESMQKPWKYFQNNTINSINLLKIMHQHQVRNIIFSSTAGVYQSSPHPLTESNSTGPTNVYAETKLMIEDAIRWYHQTQQFSYAILRYFNAAGAIISSQDQPTRGEAHQPETHLIPNILLSALDDKPFTLFGTDYHTPDGTCIRDYIHIKDLATAHLLCLNALPNNPSQVYNLGSGKGFSNLEVYQTAQKVTGKNIKLIKAPKRPGDAPILVASPDKIKKELNWQPQYQDLKYIIESAWLWHQSHPQGYLSK